MSGVAGDHADPLHDSGYLVAKILAPLLLFCLTMAFGLCPILIVKPTKKNNALDPAEKPDGGQTRDSKLIAFTACVGGGVLFATALLHILPESRAGFEKWSNKSHDADHHHHDHHDHDHDHEHKHDSHHGHDHSFPLAEFVTCLGFLIVYLLDEVIHACVGHKSHVNEDHGHSHSPQVIQCATNGEQVTNPAFKPYYHFAVLESGNAHAAAQEREPSVGLGGLITVAALSFHSIFEGLSLGLQDQAGKTWLLTLAIATHKLVIAFVVGFELCATGWKKPHVMVSILIFSIMSPLGAFAGFTAQSLIEQNTLVTAILNALAAGTLLFVVFFEVLQKQKNTSLHGLLQLVAVILGFVIMILLGLLVSYLSNDETPLNEAIEHALNGTALVH